MLRASTIVSPRRFTISAPNGCRPSLRARAASSIARRARAGGDHPFGAILVDADGAVLMEQGNGYSAEGHDMTAHAERLLGDAELAKCTLYTSTEPCAMCAGAIYWVGVGRVVYALSEQGLARYTGPHEENPTLDLPCREVFARGQRRVAVAGPAIEDEAGRVHEGFWI